MNNVLILAVAITTVVTGDVIETTPDIGVCVCFKADRAKIYSSECGNVLGTTSIGHCFIFNGVKETCSLNGNKYEFYQFQWNGTDVWSADVDLELASNSKCSSVDTLIPKAASNEYSCQVTDHGKRIHETLHHTPYECVDYRCRNTCKGGQCVAYVTCRCKRNGRWTPNTGCWRAGQRLKTSSGKCNRNIAPYTAIATFTSQGRYYGHAAVFVGCRGDYAVQVYDQWCCRGIGYSTYPSSHRFFNSFATITSPGCSDRPSWPCRVQNSGSTCCPASVPSCRRAEFWWEAVKNEEEEVL